MHLCFCVHKNKKSHMKISIRRAASGKKKTPQGVFKIFSLHTKYKNVNLEHSYCFKVKENNHS